MRRIHYAEGSLVTGDDLAAAVLDYARMLASTATADTVEVPVLRGESRGTVRMLLGPTSQMLVEEEPGASTEIVDEALVADLHERAARLAPPSPVYSDDDVSIPFVSPELGDY